MPILIENGVRVGVESDKDMKQLEKHIRVIFIGYISRKEYGLGSR